MDSHRRHRLRISSKKLRYAIEFTGNLFPKKHSSKRRDMLAHFRTAQKLLGDLNDAEIGHSLAASLERSPSELASGENQSKQFALSKRRKKRLVQAAKLAYQKMAGVQPFWE
jgi:CHAD domain-containing protein